MKMSLNLGKRGKKKVLALTVTLQLKALNKKTGEK